MLSAARTRACAWRRASRRWRSLEIARFMGHAKVVTTLSVYAHLFEDDHADAMSALVAMSAPRTENVVRLA